MILVSKNREALLYLVYGMYIMYQRDIQ